MNLSINGHSIILILIVTFLTSFLSMFFVKKLAFHVNAIDMPNERKVHAKPMPRLGGLGIFIGFLVGYIFFGQLTSQMISIFIGAVILIILGIFDDINSIRARYKLLFQVIAASVVVFYGQIFFTEISLLGWTLYLNELWSYVLSIFFVVAITNSINLIDGLDGLAGGVSSIYFITIGIIAFILNMFSGLDVMLCMIMLGSTLGFLIHNFPPAKIFMGDSGSLFLGFMISVIALIGFKVTTITTLIVPVLILAIPIFDTVFAIGRRLLNKQNIGEADKEHFHHQLLKLKFSSKTSILIIYLINIMFASVSVFFVLGDQEMAILIYVILMIFLLFLVLKTNILFKNKEKVNKK